MTVELRMFGVVLGLVQIVAAFHAASLQPPPLRGVAGRLDRALRNFVETFPLFAAVVLAAHVTETHSAHGVGARLYLWARVAYVLLYATGVPLVRSLVYSALR